MALCSSSPWTRCLLASWNFLPTSAIRDHAFFLRLGRAFLCGHVFPAQSIPRSLPSVSPSIWMFLSAGAWPICSVVRGPLVRMTDFAAIAGPCCLGSSCSAVVESMVIRFIASSAKCRHSYVVEPCSRLCHCDSAAALAHCEVDEGSSEVVRAACPCEQGFVGVDEHAAAVVQAQEQRCKPGAAAGTRRVHAMGSRTPLLP